MEFVVYVRISGAEVTAAVADEVDRTVVAQAIRTGTDCQPYAFHFDILCIDLYVILSQCSTIYGQ